MKTIIEAKTLESAIAVTEKLLADPNTNMFDRVVAKCDCEIFKDWLSHRFGGPNSSIIKLGKSEVEQILRYL